MFFSTQAVTTSNFNVYYKPKKWDSYGINGWRFPVNNSNGVFIYANRARTPLNPTIEFFAHEIEDLYTDALQMKEKSNTGKYLKYRPKHSFKATVDFQWKRINLGANFAWKSKILAVDYLMMDEREKQQQDLMDYVRTILFGKSRGETLATYWKKHNTDYATVDLRFGVKATKEVAFQFMVNNLLNKEYSYRPMAVAAPRTFVVKMDITF